MQIVKYPPIYSPAFGEVVFQISAAAEELLELDILANDQTTVIGKKRFRGSTLYRVNMAGYGRRQIEVTPQRPAASSFAFPDKRIINLTLRSGNVRAATVMSAGTKQLDSYAKLSGSPDTIPISASKQDEFTILVDDGIPLSAEARLTGPDHNTTLTAIASTTAAGLTSICLNMPHLDTKLRALGKGSLNDYETLEIGVMIETDQLLSQKYRLVPDSPDHIRLCWWNSFGQIDYYTMLRSVSDTFKVGKTRIYTQEGYKTIHTRGETAMRLISDFVTAQTMTWISEIIASPRVWIDHGNRIEPVEIVTDRIITSSDNLLQLEIELVKSERTVYPHL